MLYHPDPSLFIDNARKFGALGEAMVSLSNLEFAHDNFIFKMHELHRDLTITLSKRFPRHFKEKTDFLVKAVANMPALKQQPIFQSGELSLQWLQYQVDELYDIRSILAHGSIFFSEESPDRITWTFERFVQGSDKGWYPQGVKMSNGYLASVDYTARALRSYLVDLVQCLEGGFCWESHYQADKEIRKNRKFFAELMELGVIPQDDPWIKAFPPMDPV